MDHEKTEKEWVKEIFSHISKADYKTAYAAARGMKRDHPTSTRAQYQEASVMGDFALSLTGRSHEIMHRAAIRKLKRVVARMKNERHLLLSHGRNELYYQTKKFKHQYENGVVVERSGQDSYGTGVGASQLAYWLAKRGRSKAATQWALRALAAWEREFQKNPDYYNSYVHYALALGVLGRLEEMENALKKSASLASQPLDAQEFREVRRDISLLRKNS